MFDWWFTAAQTWPAPQSPGARSALQTWTEPWEIIHGFSHEQLMPFDGLTRFLLTQKISWEGPGRALESMGDLWRFASFESDSKPAIRGITCFSHQRNMILRKYMHQNAEAGIQN